MTSPNPWWDHIPTATLEAYMPTLQDNVFNGRPFLNWLMPRREGQDGGRTMNYRLEYEENDTVEYYGGYDLLPIKPQEGLSMADYKSCQQVVAISISGEEEAENAGEHQGVELLTQKISNAEKSKMHVMNRDLIRAGTYEANRGMTGPGNGGKGAIGLEGIINWRQNPLLGRIDARENEFWRSIIDDNGYYDAVEAGDDPATAAPPKPLNLFDFGNMHDTIGEGVDPVDTIWCSKDLYQSYRGMLQPQLIQTNPETAAMGFSNIMFMGTTIMWDVEIPDGTIYFVNTQHLKLKYYTNRWFSTTGFTKPHNQDARHAHIISKYQLMTGNRRKHGMLTNRRPA